MAITGKEARKRAKAKMADLAQVSKELCTILDELPIPSPGQFEAMRSRKVPWTSEAYYAALIRNVDFRVDQARVLLKDYTDQTEHSLRALLQRGAPVPSPDIERSLRYLVEERSGEVIPPSETETIYHDPSAWSKIVLAMLFRSITTVCSGMADRLSGVEPDEAVRDAGTRQQKPS